MKTDRMMGILLTLLQKGQMSAAALARQYEVSRRTIQRDMDALAQAGVPVVAQTGATGGYRLMEDFTLERTMLPSGAWAQMVTALEALYSATGDEAVQTVLQRLPAPDALPRHVFVNLDAARESVQMRALLNTLETAVRERRVFAMTYENAGGKTTQRQVEPLALFYENYAWYLFARCRGKDAYRTFKLARIVRAEMQAETFAPPEQPVQALMAARKDIRPYVTMLIRCAPSVRVAVGEYLQGEVVQTEPDGQFLYRMTVPEGERMWFSLLLGFGDAIEVLSPEKVRDALCQTARDILSRYVKR